ncbi:exodeoxyribonuclease V subunit alpha [Frateuria defendens]|uniref:exodeoxyribonuclease V subunit alpha n=1 Tax=Frateuria defendens TaxID=2219559 RepID=UPI00066FD91A|nr:exodeoxyribonuclease V subunit alpha [Frateuria defendens]
MSAYRFLRAGEEAAEAPWRPLDRALLRWTLAHGGSPALARLAAWASFADGEGDTALPLAADEAGRHGMPALDPAQCDALRGEALVGDGRQPAPFVLDADARFYLWRNYADELAVATALRARQRAGAAVDDAAGEADVDTLFGGDRSPAVARQREAVRAVAGRRLFVLTGGPGTGKTTTVLRMLLRLQRRAPGAAPAIQLAAPTGKAAQRLLQSLRQGKQALRERLPPAWLPLLERIPDDDALTLHRLLGYDPRGNVFTRGPAHPLAADVVVVDEASMIDLALMRALLAAVKPQATLILVGDADQLASVAAGSALMDLVGALEAQRAPELVRLEHSFRAERQLVPVNQAVQAGDGAALRTALAAAGTQAAWHRTDDADRLRRELARWSDALAALPLRPVLPPRPAGDDDDDDAAEAARRAVALDALRALGRRQLLCALREDSYGAVALNAWIERRLKRLWQVPDERVWYPGRAVLITRNDYAARLYNGDVGLCLADADGQLRVWFEHTDAAGQATARAFTPGSLPAHEPAFALTIHKSQGSEYAHVAVLLPPDPAHRILSRQLLYTGLSRARQSVELWASEGAAEAALAQPVRRAGGLGVRLLEGISRGFLDA